MKRSKIAYISATVVVLLVAMYVLDHQIYYSGASWASRRGRLEAAQLPPATTPAQAPPAKAQRTPPKAQPRESNKRIKVDPAAIVVDDGDTVTIRWGDKDEEIVRILGIDTPETQHIEHNIPIDQPYGREARTFAQGAFSVATEVELLRCSTLDPYGRTLGYLFLNGKNYSLLVIKARLAEESVTRYGDNGFPEIAAEVLAASKSAGPLPFEPPGLFRSRMRPLSDWMKAQGAAR